MKNRQRVLVEIDSGLYKQFSKLAIDLEITKRKFVEMGLIEVIKMHGLIPVIINERTEE